MLAIIINIELSIIKLRNPEDLLPPKFLSKSTHTDTNTHTYTVCAINIELSVITLCMPEEPSATTHTQNLERI